jgi:hypothetical protein
MNKPGRRRQERLQQAGAGKLVKAAVGGKLHRRREKTHFPHEL